MICWHRTGARTLYWAVLAVSAVSVLMGYGAYFLSPHVEKWSKLVRLLLPVGFAVLGFFSWTLALHWSGDSTSSRPMAGGVPGSAEHRQPRA